MSEPPPVAAERRAEAERLIERGRALLIRPDEEMVVNYLNHAIETLHMIGEEDRPPRHARSLHTVNCPSKVPAPNRGSPAPALARPAEQ